MDMTPQLFSELKGHPVRWQADGTITAPAVDVAELLMAIRPGRVGDDNALVLSRLPAARNGALSLIPGPAPGSFHVTGADEPIELAVNPPVPAPAVPAPAVPAPAVRALAVRARYGGIYTIEPTTDGCRVLHRVHWIHPALQQHTVEAPAWMSFGLEQVLLVIADRLGLGSRAIAAGFDVVTHAGQFSYVEGTS